MPNFTPMGGVPDFYSQLLGAAQQGLVKMPDNTYRPAPQFGGSTSVGDIYRGIIPSAPSPSDPIGPGTSWGALTGFATDPIYSGNNTYGQPPQTAQQTTLEQQAARRAIPRIPSVAQLPSIPGGGAAGGNQALAAIGNLVGVPQASGTINNAKDQTRLQTQALAFNGDQGGLPPLPRVRPAPPAANVPMPIPRPPMALPVRASAPPPAAPPGQYIVQAGDTLSQLSKRFGVPVAALASQSGIKNPDRIGIGQRINVVPTVPPAPRRTASFLSGDPGQVDWSRANQGMQGIYGPNNATGPATTAPSRQGKYTNSTAPGTWNREEGRWN